MTPDWLPKETSTYQDHVIAHVIGTTVLGYLIADQAAHLLLDIGFVWTIYLDGEMGLLPQSVAISEVELDKDVKAEIAADAQLLHEEGLGAERLARLTSAPVECLITEVSFYARDERRRLLLAGEEASLVIETSLATGEMSVETFHPESSAS
ncbi:MAG TPA: hypothetical protein VD966_06445 [Pyrinomonadaceae bacterium]|nr:hypothetical protein [Pyrinomonadaceae bacterium]